MGWFEDFFDDTLDVVADAVVGVSSVAIDTAVKARRAGVVFPQGEAVHSPMSPAALGRVD